MLSSEAGQPTAAAENPDWILLSGCSDVQGVCGSAYIINVSCILSGGTEGHWVDRDGVQLPWLEGLYKTSVCLSFCILLESTLATGMARVQLITCLIYPRCCRTIQATDAHNFSLTYLGDLNRQTGSSHRGLV